MPTDFREMGRGLEVLIASEFGVKTSAGGVRERDPDEYTVRQRQQAEEAVGAIPRRTVIGKDGRRRFRRTSTASTAWRPPKLEEEQRAYNVIHRLTERLRFHGETRGMLPSAEEIALEPLESVPAQVMEGEPSRGLDYVYSTVPFIQNVMTMHLEGATTDEIYIWSGIKERLDDGEEDLRLIARQYGIKVATVRAITPLFKRKDATPADAFRQMKENLKKVAKEAYLILEAFSPEDFDREAVTSTAPYRTLHSELGIGELTATGIIEQYLTNGKLRGIEERVLQTVKSGYVSRTHLKDQEPQMRLFTEEDPDPVITVDDSESTLATLVNKVGSVAANFDSQQLHEQTVHQIPIAAGPAVAIFPRYARGSEELRGLDNVLMIDEAGDRKLARDLITMLAFEYKRNPKLLKAVLDHPENLDLHDLGERAWDVLRGIAISTYVTLNPGRLNDITQLRFGGWGLTITPAMQKKKTPRRFDGDQLRFAALSGGLDEVVFDERAGAYLSTPGTVSTFEGGSALGNSLKGSELYGRVFHEARQIGVHAIEDADIGGTAFYMAQHMYGNILRNAQLRGSSLHRVQRIEGPIGRNARIGERAIWNVWLPFEAFEDARVEEGAEALQDVLMNDMPGELSRTGGTIPHHIYDAQGRPVILDLDNRQKLPGDRGEVDTPRLIPPYGCIGDQSRAQVVSAFKKS